MRRGQIRRQATKFRRLHGVGASVVNALSRRMKVQVFQDGKVYQQEYKRGKILYDLKVVGETDRTGTTI